MGFSEARLKEGGGAMLVAYCHALTPQGGSGRNQQGGPGDGSLRLLRRVAGCTREYNYYTGEWADNRPPMEYEGLEVYMLKFENGALGKVTANYDCIMPYNFPIEIFGDRGTVKDNRIWSHLFPGQKDWIEIPTILPTTADVGHHPFQGEIDHFVDCIINGRESHCNLEDAAHTHEIIFAAQQCYATGQPVRLPIL